MKENSMNVTRSIGPLWSVNEVIVTYPETVAVFNRFGVDSCCRGDATLEQAALESGIDQGDLITALLTATGERENLASAGL
jgi:iron-sulfur cluster repair protein YtfE (RIC family)